MILKNHNIKHHLLRNVIQNLVGDLGNQMPAEEQTRLASELEYYELHKLEWLRQHSGNYVVVKGNGVLGFYTSFESAYRAGANSFGMGADFLVKQILEHEPVFFVF